MRCGFLLPFLSFLSLSLLSFLSFLPFFLSFFFFSSCFACLLFASASAIAFFCAASSAISKRVATLSISSFSTLDGFPTTFALSFPFLSLFSFLTFSRSTSVFLIADGMAFAGTAAGMRFVAFSAFIRSIMSLSDSFFVGIFANGILATGIIACSVSRRTSWLMYAAERATLFSGRCPACSARRMPINMTFMSSSDILPASASFLAAWASSGCRTDLPAAGTRARAAKAAAISVGNRKTTMDGHGEGRPRVAFAEW
mmetsp:Transcript_10904/g.34664  ORF Transcript_10904/g.34664 Transcript_10904/m.34664 type:complete len:256 (-) Transcript_10904:42-809(-)